MIPIPIFIRSERDLIPEHCHSREWHDRRVRIQDKKQRATFAETVGEIKCDGLDHWAHVNTRLGGGKNRLVYRLGPCFCFPIEDRWKGQTDGLMYASVIGKPEPWPPEMK